MKLSQRLLNFIPKLWANWIALLGTTLTTLSGNVILVVIMVELVSQGSNQYASAMAFLAMPPVFLFGLFLIAVGAWLDHRRISAGAPPSAIDEAVNIMTHDRTARRRLVFVAVASLLNITIISLASY